MKNPPTPAGTARANQQSADAIVCAAIAAGVKDVVVSPGSRNTPLVLAFHRAAGVKKTVVLDERSAGFFALGCARARGAPVALVCTSGSALANYYPAIVEAYHSLIPLIVLTADRPAELQGRDAPQTMDQMHFFGNFARSFAHQSAPDDHTDAATVYGTARRCFGHAIHPIPGPVQLNCAFREPLWSPTLKPTQPEPAEWPEDSETPTADAAPDHPSLVQLARLSQTVSRGGQGVFVCGTDAFRWGGRDALFSLAEKWGWPVLCEAASQGRFGQVSALSVEAYDLIARSQNATLQPDIVIRLGRPSLSKALSQWIQSLPDGHLVTVDPYGRVHDPEQKAQGPLKMSVADFVDTAMTWAVNSETNTAWLETWSEQDRTAKALIETLDGPLWEGWVVRTVSNALPEDSTLHVANSMPIRDLDAFAFNQGRRLFVCVNRGLNGIDGTLATAAGEAHVRNTHPCVVVTGDLAFRHDITSLRLLGDTHSTVVVLDNGGGHIFDFLPISQHPDAFETYFVTPQETSIMSLCEGMAVRCRTTSTPQDFSDVLHDELERESLGVVVVTIDPNENVAQHTRIWHAMGRRHLP